MASLAARLAKQFQKRERRQKGLDSDESSAPAGSLWSALCIDIHTLAIDLIVPSRHDIKHLAGNAGLFHTTYGLS